MFAKDHLIAALRLRYDAYSAEAVFEMARDRAGVPNKSELDARELAAFRAALAVVGDRVTRVLAELDEMLGAPAAPAAPAAKDGKDAKPAAAKAKDAAPVKEAAPKPVEAATPVDAPKPVDAAAVETTIALTGLDVADGEQVLVCGGFAELGDWDPERARPMARKGDAWLTTVKVAPDADIAFKFLRRTKDGKVIWESGDDRHLVAKPRLDATWRAAT